MKYTHLTQDERYQIAILAKAGHDKSEIARFMNRHKSTISREMTRNRGARGYKNLVLAGARYHKFPNEYVAAIEATPSKPDPDAKRTQEN